MKKYTLTEQELYDLLKFSFIAGENYQQNWALEQTGEIEEITEPNFDEYYKQLDLK